MYYLIVNDVIYREKPNKILIHLKNKLLFIMKMRLKN